MNGPAEDRPGYEIERKWLLHRLPDRLVHAEGGEMGAIGERLRIRQGYLPPATESDFADFDQAGPDDVPVVGRIRSIEFDGPPPGIRFIHTIKSGSGLVRRELERSISITSFEAAWPATLGRRIEKTRWRISEEGSVWEVDHLQGMSDLGHENGGLVLLEVEADDPEQARRLNPPGWLAEVVDREVTDEPAFTNAEIAFRLGRG
ncbi:MAG: hypothetical protein GY895_02835 [Phycisphaera sp.]|nr:hypothetical protein [Phycisphaera sp.]